jgi:4-azaleucine resistance transporter AzlC
VTTRRQAMRDGVTDVAPMLVGIIPFGLVAGAAPIAAGLDLGHAVGMSLLLFAGASQLAMADVLGSDGGIAVAVVTALTINLRMLLYSASLAPTLSSERLGARLRASYFLVDQAYALSIVRWDGDDDRRQRLPYYFAIGLLLWSSWQITTVVGALVGSSVPDDVPLDFAVPLVFLVLLVPVLQRWPSLVAAAVGGTIAVTAAELGAARLAILIGGVAGIVAGTVAEGHQERRREATQR